MRADVGIVIATADRRPEMLRTELESIAVAMTVAKAKGVRSEVVIAHDYDGAGVAETLAAGLGRTDARYTSFWGDDDWMMPDYIVRHLALAAEGFDVVAGSMVLADANLDRTGERILPPARLADFLVNQVTVNDGALVRAETRVPLRPERGRAMMMTFWMDMLAAGRTFGVVTEPTWVYRQHPGQLSSSWSAEDFAMRHAAIAEHRA